MSTTTPRSPLPYGYKLVKNGDDGGGYIDGPNGRPWVCVAASGFKDLPGFVIQPNSDDRVPQAVRNIVFPTAEHAGAVGVAICLAHDRSMKQFTVPKALLDAIEAAERNARDLEKAARDVAFQVAYTRHSANQLRKAAGLPEKEWKDDDLLETLKTFTLGAGKAKHMRHPFFTEATLYDLLGKEDARSVLGIIEQVKRRIDPVGGAL